jgi:tetratricopeptide (TPR) repeat protein
MHGSDEPSGEERPPGGSGAFARGGGDWFGALGQLDFDIDFFERLLGRSPDHVEGLRVLGELFSRKGLLGRALEIDRRLVTLLPDDALARYNLACSLALVGRDDEALEHLAAAFRLGYDDVAHMEVDPDLASLRGRPEFRALLDRVG